MALGQDTATLEYLPWALTLLTALVAVGYERANRRLSAFSPLVGVSVVYAVIFAVVPLSDLWFDHPIVDHVEWTGAGWLLWMGLLLLLSGYHAARFIAPGHGWTVIRGWNPRRATICAALLMAVSVLAVLSAVSNVGVAAYLSGFADRNQLIRGPEYVYGAQPVGSAVILSMMLAPVAVLLQAGSWVQRPSWRSTAYLLVLLGLGVLTTGFLGGRWRTLTIVVGLLAIFHLYRRRIPTAVLGAVGLAMVAAIIFWGLSRNVVGTGVEASSVRSGADLYYVYVASSYELAQARDFSVTLGEIPDRVAFQRGRTLLSIVPGAPFPTGGFVYSSTVYPAVYAGGTSVPTPLPGELYLNFGYAAIVVGMLVLGIGLGLLQRFYRANTRSIAVVVVYAYSIVPLGLLARGDFTTFAGNYFAGLAVLATSLLFITRPVTLPRPSNSLGP